jgi:hypothetical protein
MNRPQRTRKSPRPPRPAFPALPRALRAIEVAWARRLDPAAKAYSELRPLRAEDLDTDALGRLLARAEARACRLPTAAHQVNRDWFWIGAGAPQGAPEGRAALAPASRVGRLSCRVGTGPAPPARRHHPGPRAGDGRLAAAAAWGPERVPRMRAGVRRSAAAEAAVGTLQRLAKALGVPVTALLE